jgi:WXG100 family type VII secretion target
MSDVIKLNYPAMQEMSSHCKQVSQRLNQTVAMARQIANEMQNSALVGDPGEAFATALNNSFSPAVMKLAQKFEEVSKDIEAAISDMQASDKAAGGQF